MTEAIPKRLFDQANLLRKTLYQRSVQVPKIGTKQVFLAINPTPGGVKPYSSTSSSSGAGAVSGGGAASKQVRYIASVVWSVVLTLLSLQAPASKPVTDQVSILVKPSAGGNAVLLNVPRNVALKVKVGTTLSFSASTDQKYTVIDNKLHPPVGKHKPPAPAPAPANTNTNTAKLPSLPSGVSIRPVAPGAGPRASPVTSGRPAHPPRPANIKKPTPPPARTSRPDVANFTPCSPFCPGKHYHY